MEVRAFLPRYSFFPAIVPTLATTSARGTASCEPVAISFTAHTPFASSSSPITITTRAPSIAS